MQKVSDFINGVRINHGEKISNVVFQKIVRWDGSTASSVWSAFYGIDVLDMFLKEAINDN